MTTLPIRSPMLAPNQRPSEKDIRFPVYASIKMDGIRCLVYNNGLISRSGKYIPNQRIWVKFAKLALNCDFHHQILDGELWIPGVPFGEISSMVMSQSVDCDKIQYHVFDALSHQNWLEKKSVPFQDRVHIYEMRLRDWAIPSVVPVAQTRIETYTQLMNMYDSAIADGHEGLIIKDPWGFYKWGRCTMREGAMYKLKGMDELDAVVVGVEEQQGIAPWAERETNELGYSKSVTRQDDKMLMGTLGALVVKDESGRQFNVGTGFTAVDRRKLWDIKDQLIGKWCKIKYVICGEKDLPRHPVFQGFRDDK